MIRACSESGIQAGAPCPALAVRRLAMASASGGG